MTLHGYNKNPDYTPPTPKGYARVQVWIIGAIVLMVLVGIPLLASAKDWTYYNGVRVVDVDTLDFKSLDHHVRIKDSDGPEHGHRAKCDKERALSVLADAYAAEVLSKASVVKAMLSDPPKQDRYKRYVAPVLVDGEDYADLMIAAGYMKNWDYGNEPKPDWCG